MFLPDGSMGTFARLWGQPGSGPSARLPRTPTWWHPHWPRTAAEHPWVPGCLPACSLPLGPARHGAAGANSWVRIVPSDGSSSQGTGRSLGDSSDPYDWKIMQGDIWGTRIWGPQIRYLEMPGWSTAGVQVEHWWSITSTVLQQCRVPR